MSSVFVIRNQHGHYLNKQGVWIDGREAASLYRTVHRDEAVNSVFEASSRDVAIRAETVVCELDARGNPRVEIGTRQLVLADDSASGTTAPPGGDDSAEAVAPPAERLATIATAPDS